MLQVQELEALLLSSQRPHEAFDRIVATAGPAERGQLDHAWLGAQDALVSKMEASEVGTLTLVSRLGDLRARGCRLPMNDCLQAACGC